MCRSRVIFFADIRRVVYWNLKQVARGLGVFQNVMGVCVST